MLKSVVLFFGLREEYSQMISHADKLGYVFGVCLFEQLSAMVVHSVGRQK